MRVLIVSVDLERRVVWRDALLAHGVEEVLLADTEIQALECVPKFRGVTIALVDLYLPGARARDLIVTLAAAVQSLAVVAVAKEQQPPPRGAEDVLCLPCDVEAMCQRVSSLAPDVIARQIAPFVVVLLREDKNGPRNISASGTGCLIRTQEATFLLTAAHVVRAIGRASTDWRIAGDGPLIPIGTWPTIAVSDRLDIGTISVPQDFDPSKIGRQYYRTLRWPAPRVREKEVVVWVGFGGDHRDELGAHALFRGSILTEFVTHSGRLEFQIWDPNKERQLISNSGVSFGASSGGFSGSPVFVNRESDAGIVGVIKEGSEDGVHSTYLVSHADFVRPDGTIDDSLLF